MDATSLNHRIFKTSASVATATAFSALNQQESVLNSPATSLIPYTEVMLCEYYHLVNSLAKLSDMQLQSIQADINQVLNKLTKWLDKAGSVNAIELLSAMRHLKQKAKSNHTS